MSSNSSCCDGNVCADMWQSSSRSTTLTASPGSFRTTGAPIAVKPAAPAPAINKPADQRRVAELRGQSTDEVGAENG